MLRWRVGVASSPEAGRAMAKYYQTEPLRVGREDLARYYSGESLPEPKTFLDRVGREVAAGNLGYEDALAELVDFCVENDLNLQPHAQNLMQSLASEVVAGDLAYSDGLNDLVAFCIQNEPSFDCSVDALEKLERKLDAAFDGCIEEAERRAEAQTKLEAQLDRSLDQAVRKAEAEKEVAEGGGTLARWRPDMPSHVAEAMAIDTLALPASGEISNLLNGLRANGERIVGKQMQAPMRPLTEIFGLNGKAMPSAVVVERISHGLRADGSEPKQRDGSDYADGVVEGARKRFLSIYGAKEDFTTDHLDLMKQGRTVDGAAVESSEYLRKVNATKAPVAYIDLVWSPDKSISVAWALANTEAERQMLVQVHREAVNCVMSYVEEVLGVCRRGKEGAGGTERGHLAWMMFDHYTARPTAEIEQIDDQGRAYTAFADVPMKTPDMQLHTHTPLFNAVFCDSGRVGAIDLDLLDGRTKEFGRVYQAFVARGLRELGIDVRLNERTGAAQIMSIPEHVRKHFSKRGQDAQRAAREYAERQGLDWDQLPGSLKYRLLEKGVEETKNRKFDRDGVSDFDSWFRQSLDECKYVHDSVLRKAPVLPERTRDERRQAGYDQSLPWVSGLFANRAKISGQELREMVAQSLIENGIENPGDDIAAITKGFRERGVLNEGQMTPIIWGEDAPIRGKKRWSVTTEFHETTERELLQLARQARGDHSASLSRETLDKHLAEFLAANPKIKPEGPHWEAQKAAYYAIGEGGKLDGAIGAAGSGKTTVAAPLVASWKSQGYRVYGIALAWAHASALRGSGIEEGDRAAIAAFLKRVQKGRYKLDKKTIVLIDEFGKIGKREFLTLMRMQAKTGCSIKFIGDPKQCQAVEADPVMRLMVRAFGEDAFPEIATTIRQATEREQDIATLFRQGKAREAIAMKREDGTVHLVAGGRDATITRAAKEWRRRMEENAHRPDFKLGMTGPTNRDVMDIGVAVRQQMREMGRLGDDAHTVTVSDGAGDKVPMPLSVGEKVRVFNRIYSPANPPYWEEGGILANNSDILEIVRFTPAGFWARNEDGMEGLVRWDKIRDDHGTTKLVYGYARTIDSTQSATNTREIDVLPDGSGPVQAYMAYVAESRHVEESVMIVNEAAQRKALFETIPLGAYREIREDEIWDKLAADLSRQPEKASAMDFIAQAKNLCRGTVLGFQVAMEPLERRNREAENAIGIKREREALDQEMERSGLMQKVRDMRRAIADRWLPGKEREDQELENSRL